MEFDPIVLADALYPTLSAFSAVETVAIVINAATGIEYGARRMMDYAKARNLCRLLVVNRIDADPGHLAQLVEDPSDPTGPDLYVQLASEVRDFLLERALALVNAGVARERICIDPGIGFGKSLAHNIALLRGLPQLAGFGFPVLVGASRKRFIGMLTGVEVTSAADLRAAARALVDLGASAALVKGGHLRGNEAVDLFGLVFEWSLPPFDVILCTFLLRAKSCLCG